MLTTPRKFTATNLKECEVILLDVGGTLKKGNQLLPGAVDLIQELIRLRKPYYIVSNTTEVSELQLAEELRELGLHVKDEHVFTANTATLHYCKKKEWKRVTLLGTKKQAALYNEQGLEVMPIGDSTADGIIVSQDPTLTYEALTAITRQIANGTPYIATNTDPLSFGENGPSPDTGATIGFIGVATGVEPQAVTGKPSSLLVELVAEHAEVPVRRMGMIGDQLNVDIKMAHRSGLVSALVLSGNSTHSEAESSKYRPDYIVEDVGRLIPLLS